MKTRIKKVVYGSGNTSYYPQVKGWFLWHNLLDRWENTISFGREEYAKEKIDNLIKEQEIELKKNQQIVTYIKYP